LNPLPIHLAFMIMVPGYAIKDRSLASMEEE
jgi:hypothetical protein